MIRKHPVQAMARIGCCEPKGIGGQAVNLGHGFILQEADLGAIRGLTFLAGTIPQFRAYIPGAVETKMSLDPPDSLYGLA
jgi:hypothetical protein